MLRMRSLPWSSRDWQPDQSLPTEPPIMATTGLDPVHNGLSSLSQVRLALPATLLGILVLRLAARAFLAMMDKIQAQGWEGPAEEDEPLPPSSNPQARGNQAKAGADGDEGEVEAVVVKAPGQIRKGLILGLVYLIGAGYFAEGAAHVIASLIKQEMTPSLPLFAHSIEYTAGGLAALAGLGAGLIWDERTVGLDSFKAIYLKMFAVIGWALELAAISYLATVLRLDPTLGRSTGPLASFTVGFVALRLLLYTGLLLSLTPVLYRPAYAPIADSAAGERTSLLNPDGTANNDDATVASADYGTPAPLMPKNTLRASRPPSNRPPDPKSLSFLAFFTRIKVLFPYLWPSKSRSLQALAVVCVFLMLLKRVVNVATPILFGRVIQDLVEGRPPYLNVGLYVLLSFLQDTNQSKPHSVPPSTIIGLLCCSFLCSVALQCCTGISGFRLNSSVSVRCLSFRLTRSSTCRCRTTPAAGRASCSGSSAARTRSTTFFNHSCSTGPRSCSTFHSPSSCSGYGMGSPSSGSSWSCRSFSCPPRSRWPSRASRWSASCATRTSSCTRSRPTPSSTTRLSRSSPRSGLSRTGCSTLCVPTKRARLRFTRPGTRSHSSRTASPRSVCSRAPSCSRGGSSAARWTSGPSKSNPFRLHYNDKVGSSMVAVGPAA